MLCHYIFGVLLLPNFTIYVYFTFGLSPMSYFPSQPIKNLITPHPSDFPLIQMHTPPIAGRFRITKCEMSQGARGSGRLLRVCWCVWCALLTAAAQKRASEAVAAAAATAAAGPDTRQTLHLTQAPHSPIATAVWPAEGHSQTDSLFWCSRYLFRWIFFIYTRAAHQYAMWLVSVLPASASFSPAHLAEWLAHHSFSSQIMSVCACDCQMAARLLAGSVRTPVVVVRLLQARFLLALASHAAHS